MHLWAKKVVKHYSGVTRLSSPFFLNGSRGGIPYGTSPYECHGGVRPQEATGLSEQKRTIRAEFRCPVVRPLRSRRRFFEGRRPRIRGSSLGRSASPSSGIASWRMGRAVVATLGAVLSNAPGREWHIHKPGPRRIRERRITYPSSTPSFGLTLPILGPIIRNRFQADDSHQV